MRVVARQANQLAVGDVIVDAAGDRHTVTEVVVHGLAGAWLSFATDSGLRIDKSQDEAKLDTYNVLAD
ncbi:MULTISPECIES: hypothetical protein [Mycobacterium avium complex (MAC)]|uniref:hypothetical protein n=1 Tax=Mycobacterium avium complex (MAC) TaxID=120793 RepID=UPI000A0368AC|nr:MULTISPECIES: hypothetical protein [Mycobacterium avium complex (MAC)]UCN12769.1 hypothetical protein LFT50_28000 [Mycobacterium intracellulare subsp. chimaera]